MKLGISFVLLLLQLSHSAFAADTFCSLVATNDWPEIFSETKNYFTERLSARDSERLKLDQEFQILASKSITLKSETDEKDLKKWIQAMREMTEVRSHPDLIHALTRASLKGVKLNGKGTRAEKIKKQLQSLSPEQGLELGLSLSEEIESILESSRDSALKEKIANWQDLYPETLGVFLVSNLTKIVNDDPKALSAGVSGIADKIKSAIGSLSSWSTGFLRSKQAISDARFKRMLNLGPKTANRLRFVTAVQVGLAVGSFAVMLNDLDSTGLYNIVLQVFGPVLGSSMTGWAYAGAPAESLSVDAKKRIEKRWTMWGAVAFTQSLGMVMPSAEWFSNLVFGPGGLGVLLGRSMAARSLAIDKTHAANAIVDSVYFMRLSEKQLMQLLAAVGPDLKQLVQDRIKEISSQN